MNRKNNLGHKIKEWRKQRKLTQEELAFKIQRSTEAVSMIERGINLPSHDTIELISKVFEIPIHEFYKNHSTKIPINEKEEIIERIVGILYLMDLKKITAIEKQIEAMRDV